MRASPNRAARRRTAIAGAGLCAGIGLLVGLLGWGNLDLRSYDIPFAFRAPAPPPEVVIVYLDENSYDKLGNQRPSDFDRAHHARLLDYLTRDGARLVVFDIWFGEPDPNRPKSDQAFAQAIQRHGKVVLMSEIDKTFGLQRLPPWEGFKTNAAGSGITPVEHDLDSVVRQFNWRKAAEFALPWVAASQTKTNLPDINEYVRTVWWLNYYGPPDALHHVSYVDATNQPAGFFKSRDVFVGSRTVSQYAREHSDQFRTPYTPLEAKYSSGVEIVATAFLNLIRNESLRRLPAWLEILSILLVGALAGFGLGFCRPRTGTIAALTGAGLLAALGIALVQPTRIWFPWLIPVVVQIPCGWAWAAWAEFKSSRRQTIPIPIQRLGVTGSSDTTQVIGEKPRVADHELIRRIGRGAYGEVWLARNTVGMLQAVKIVHRGTFDRPGPYEREFRGIEKFMPISRSHPGFVHILHVGRDDEKGLFYYMMELADDVTTGRTITPETYTPRTLASAIRQKGARPIRECVELGLSLSVALEQLHQNNLIHRDIKPANILFVNDGPKLGDIGLVTAVEDAQGRPSFVGTPGFVPPEGPGAPAADVYALGKLLYEAAVGWDAERFPELPTELGERPDQEELLQFHDFLWRACEPNVSRRFDSAAAFHAALLKLKEAIGAGK